MREGKGNEIRKIQWRGMGYVKMMQGIKNNNYDKITKP